MNIYLEAKSWCIANGIKIYIVPIRNRKECYVRLITMEKSLGHHILTRIKALHLAKFGT